MICVRRAGPSRILNLGTCKMTRAMSGLGVISVLALSACAVAPPQGPSVMALPAQGKSFEAFQQDDMACRSYATQQTGGASATQAANNSAVGSALLGTALGAGVGAALGSVGGAVGAGAAIGGATGLLAGSAIGAGNAQASGGNVQARYDTAYTQCMYQGRIGAGGAQRLCRGLWLWPRLPLLLSRSLLRSRLFRTHGRGWRWLGMGWRLLRRGLASPLVRDRGNRRYAPLGGGNSSARLSHVSVDLVLGPGGDLLDRLAITKTSEHLVVYTATVDLHSDIRSRFGCCERWPLSAGRP